MDSFWTFYDEASLDRWVELSPGRQALLGEQSGPETDADIFSERLKPGMWVGSRLWGMQERRKGAGQRAKGCDEGPGENRRGDRDAAQHRGLGEPVIGNTDKWLTSNQRTTRPPEKENPEDLCGNWKVQCVDCRW